MLVFIYLLKSLAMTNFHLWHEILILTNRGGILLDYLECPKKHVESVTPKVTDLVLK